MASCLIGLGSNLGDRQATLEKALRDIESFPQTTLLRTSRFYEFAPIGGPAGQNLFLNASALLATELPPEALHAEMKQVELRCGRKSSERWAARTLDLDLLLYDDLVVETSQLAVPHPRMSFRRFVLQPAAEIATDMFVPTIGWSIQRLFDCVRSSNDRLAILSSSRELRSEIARRITSRFGGSVLESGVDDDLWPREQATWISLAGESQPPVNPTKLTVALESSPGEWRQPGRGPTLALCTQDIATIEQEASAAIASVWPELGSQRGGGIE